ADYPPASGAGPFWLQPRILVAGCVLRFAGSRSSDKLLPLAELRPAGPSQPRWALVSPSFYKSWRGSRPPTHTSAECSVCLAIRFDCGSRRRCRLATADAPQPRLPDPSQGTFEKIQFQRLPADDPFQTGDLPLEFLDLPVSHIDLAGPDV